MGQTINQVVLVSFFRFPPKKRIWGMKQMMVTQKRLNNTEGLQFHKMLGTGGGAGYSFRPDFGTYALLTVWDNYDAALSFESDSPVMNEFRENAREIYSIFLKNIQVRGYWSQVKPFTPCEPDPDNKIIVILTRATIKPGYYLNFWKRVGGISRSHIIREGLIFTKGLGERPWIMQATFSVWDSVENMDAFAHRKGGRHNEAIETTRRKKGFKEELYARFQPVSTRGSWFGKDPLGEAIRNNNS